MTQPETCRHPGKPVFAFEWLEDGIRWIAWCRGCGLEDGGVSHDPIAIFEEWMVEKRGPEGPQG